MIIKNLQGQNKKKKAVERFKNRIPLPNMLDRKQLDIQIIDTALRAMYNEGDKVPRSLQQDILAPNKIKISERDADRIWDVMMSTGLVNSVIGFGNAGKMTLTNEGYQLMSQYGSYSAFLEERRRQQMGQGMVFPQFIIEQQQPEQKDAEDADGGEGAEKAVGAKS